MKDSRHITSRENPVFKSLRTVADEPRRHGFALADGIHLVSTCLARGVTVARLLVSESGQQRPEIAALLRAAAGTDCLVLRDSLFREISGVSTPTGILALVSVPNYDPNLFVDGIDEQADAARFGVDSLRPRQGIDQQQFAQPLALILPIDSQPAQTHAGDATRQLLAPGFRQMSVVEFRQRQCEIAADTGWRFLANGDEGLRQPLVLVLAGNLPQPAVQFRATTVERLPVMAPS